jgi:hypothetical protein
MSSCQSGLHDPKVQSPLRQYHINSKTGYRPSLCDSCYNIISQATSNNIDLTTYIFELWANRSGKITSLPALLEKSYLKRANIAHFVNENLGKTREQEKKKYEVKDGWFPIIVLDSLIKDDFMGILREDELTVKNNLQDVQSASERENIALRLFVGSLDAATIFRETYISSDQNEDGSRKKIACTPKKRNDTYIGIENKASKDCIYKAGVEASLIWKLKILKDISEISLEDVPADSSIRNCLKNKKSTKVTENDLVLEKNIR